MKKFLTKYYGNMGSHQYSYLKSLFILSFLAVVVSSCGDEKELEPKVTEEVGPKVANLLLQPGFGAEHLYSPSENGQGSWVAMAFDGKGRLITSDQYGALYRLELPPIGSDSLRPTSIEKLVIGNGTEADSTGLQAGMGYAQGLLWAFNSLYVMVNNREQNEDFSKDSGLYRLQDTDGDDQFDKVTLLKSLKGFGEHGPHSIVLGPDKEHIYVIAGNHTDLPEMDAYRLPPVWQTDNLFPQIKDPRGHANDRGAPGGWIAKTDSIGEHWELVSAGYRNAFDMAFNAAGDLFAYDADMEWDFGLPWYRPTRIVHATSGSEFGWRTGNGKWPTVYPDNLPPVLNIGQGSPTNLVSGANTAFPEKYRNSLFGFDWTFGIIYAIHLEPEGSSYTATAEEFLSGSPLPLTDGVVGPDGALYFLTGGRRLQSDLYRVVYTGDGGEGAAMASDNAPVEETEEHQIRERLEQYHVGTEEGAVDFAWPYLGHDDRFLRYAARIAVEHQPVSRWKERALDEQDPQILISAIIALARHGDTSLNDEMLGSLMGIDYGDLPKREQLNLLRAIELVLFRHGEPSPAVREQLVAYLAPHYPAGSNQLDRSFSKILVHLGAPKAVGTTLALLQDAEGDRPEKGFFMESSDLILRNPRYGLDIAEMLAKTPPAQQIYLATVLSEAENGWTPELREQYFRWFHEAFGYKGGRSYIGFIDEARQRALERAPENKLSYYNSISGDSLLGSGGMDLANVAGPQGPGRNWTVEEAFTFVDTLAHQDFERGKSLFAATLCLSCHSMQGQGNAIGPDLTQLGNRFTREDILESIIEPDKVISDQYAATEFLLEDGSTVIARMINEDEDTYYVSQNPFAPQELREIPKEKVASTKISDVSIMLPGLINGMNPEELKDFMAYLVSGGNEDHELYD